MSNDPSVLKVTFKKAEMSHRLDVFPTTTLGVNLNLGTDASIFQMNFPKLPVTCQRILLPVSSSYDPLKFIFMWLLP